MKSIFTYGEQNTTGEQFISHETSIVIVLFILVGYSLSLKEVNTFCISENLIMMR